MNFTPLGLGGIFSVVALILAVVFLALGHLPIITGGLIVLLAIARLC